MLEKHYKQEGFQMIGNVQIESPRKGLIKQEVVSWEIDDNNMLHKKTVTRKFSGLDDYQDSYVSEPIIAVKS